MLLNFAVNNPIRNQSNPRLLACSLSADKTLEAPKVQVEATDTKQYTAKDVEPEVASRGDAASQYIPHAESAAKLVQAQFDHAGGKNATIAFGYSNGVALDAYIGSAIENTKKKRHSCIFPREAQQGRTQHCWFYDAGL